MKKELYVVFAGDEYYPSGGIQDWAGSHEVAGDAKAQLLVLRDTGKYQWGHAVRITTTGFEVMDQFYHPVD